jgi:hypothetical protein
MKSLHQLLHDIETNEVTKMQKRPTSELIAALDELRSALRPLDRDCTKLSEVVVKHPELNDDEPAARLMRDRAESIRSAVVALVDLRTQLNALAQSVDVKGCVDAVQA